VAYQVLVLTSAEADLERMDAVAPAGPSCDALSGLEGMRLKSSITA
jgi:hypothetical protein